MKNLPVVTKDNYFSPEIEAVYMGSSSFKAHDMLNAGTEAFGNYIAGGCEAREIAIDKGEWQNEEKKAFLVGSYVHAWFEGKEAFQAFCDQYHDKIYKSRGGMYSEFVRADEMIEIMKNDPVIMDIMKGSSEEIMTGEIAGVPIKIAVDNLNLERGYFADLKTSADISKTYYKDGSRCTFIDAYDYWLQMAMYSEIIFQNTGKYLDIYIVVVDKKTNIDHEAIYMGNMGNDDEIGDKLRAKLDEIIVKLPRMVEVRKGKKEPERCGKCGYCLATKKISRPKSYIEYRKSLGLDM